jgi:adenosylmethionine-8-amino-7-oxononanoate aminotransferase
MRQDNSTIGNTFMTPYLSTMLEPRTPPFLLTEPHVIVRDERLTVWDSAGRSYLDAMSGMTGPRHRRHHRHCVRIDTTAAEMVEITRLSTPLRRPSRRFARQ